MVAPEPAIDAALELAKSSLEHFAASATAAGSPVAGKIDASASGVELGWIGLATLAVGAHDAARALLERLGSGIITAHSPLERRLYLLLVSRYLAWTGDVPLVAAVHAQRVRHAFESLPPVGLRPRGVAPPAAAAPWETLLAELADAAEGFGDSALAGAARERSRLQRSTVEDAAALLPGGPGGEAWASFALSMPEPGYRRWLSDVEVLAGRSAAEAADLGTAWAAAAVVLPLVHGILGASPDATRHRLVLRPCLPADWATAEVSRLTLGDAAVTLRYRRDHGIFHFEVEQETGTVPLRLIFEPRLPAAGLIRTLVDNRDASLASGAAGDRITAPVQIVLDHERRLEFRTRAGERTG